MNPQKHSASVAEEQMLAHFRAHAPQQPRRRWTRRSS
ncbi:hypothetical protein K652_21052, partial [Pseudomonas aeruginosa VRFPA02]